MQTQAGPAVHFMIGNCANMHAHTTTTTTTTNHQNARTHARTRTRTLRYTTGSKQFAVFTQEYPKGAKGTNITHTTGSNVVSSCFPSIDTDPANNQSFGYVWFGGRAFLEGSVGGVWHGSDKRNGPGVGMGDGGG